MTQPTFELVRSLAKFILFFAIAAGAGMAVDRKLYGFALYLSLVALYMLGG